MRMSRYPWSKRIHLTHYRTMTAMKHKPECSADVINSGTLTLTTGTLIGWDSIDRSTLDRL